MDEEEKAEVMNKAVERFEQWEQYKLESKFYYTQSNSVLTLGRTTR
jgi:hypothetical protein